MEVLKLWIKGFKVVDLDVPLLFKAKIDKWTKPIVLVWLDRDTQLERLMARDRTSKKDARNRINAHMPLEIKRNKTDVVIDNKRSPDDSNEQIQKVLFEISRPLTWTEFWLSRQVTFSALISYF